MVSTYQHFITEQSLQAMIVHITEPRLSCQVNAEVFSLELAQLVANAAPRNLIIDFHSVKVISSSFVSALILLKKRLSRNGVFLCLCDMPLFIREVYRVLHPEGPMFDIFDSVPIELRTVASWPSGT